MKTIQATPVNPVNVSEIVTMPWWSCRTSMAKFTLSWSALQAWQYPFPAPKQQHLEHVLVFSAIGLDPPFTHTLDKWTLNSVTERSLRSGITEALGGHPDEGVRLPAGQVAQLPNRIPEGWSGPRALWLIDRRQLPSCQELAIVASPGECPGLRQSSPISGPKMSPR